MKVFASALDGRKDCTVRSGGLPSSAVGKYLKCHECITPLAGLPETVSAKTANILQFGPLPAGLRLGIGGGRGAPTMAKGWAAKQTLNPCLAWFLHIKGRNGFQSGAWWSS